MRSFQGIGWGREAGQNPVGSMMKWQSRSFGRTSWLEFRGLNIRDGKEREGERKQSYRESRDKDKVRERNLEICRECPQVFSRVLISACVWKSTWCWGQNHSSGLRRTEEVLQEVLLESSGVKHHRHAALQVRWEQHFWTPRRNPSS